MLSEQGLMILSLRDRIAELETKLDAAFVMNQRLETRVFDLSAANATLRGAISRHDATESDP